MIHNVLATDNLYHAKNLMAFNKRIDEDNFNINSLSKEDSLIIYEQIIHTADISNMLRTLEVSK
jgi:hypothetical protein